MIQPTRFGPAIAARTATLLPGRAYLSRTSNDQYRRLSTLLSDARRTPQPRTSFETTPLSSVFLSRRALHSTAIRSQEQKEQAHTNHKKAKAETESESNSEENKDGEGESSQEQKKKDVPPPPPHGDKTPWQVFTETLRSEFKKSKEWEEGTKALASSAHTFTESESVKRARAAYEAASTTATSTTSTALKSTGRAIGQGAAWTWETPVVKGLRKGVSATGKGIEKVTRPVRETEAYKSVKEAIDDGSSSRYGGWIEKEERRRQRQLREENELKSGKSSRFEPMEEDPK